MFEPARLIRGAYTLLFTIFIPVILLRLLWRSRKNPGYRSRWGERFGRFEALPPERQGGIWVHAVSVGEAIAAVPLIRQLLKTYPEKTITVTCTTPTGSAQIKRLFQDSVFHVYFPFDLPFCLKGFLKRVKPGLWIILETELWPNALSMAKKRALPVIIANARLSQKSFEGYRRFKTLLKSMMHCITTVAAQSKMDGDRYLALGLPASNLVVTGNIKFDISLPEGLEAKAAILRESWGSNRLVWIAASTHEGEEAQVLEAFKMLLTHFPDLLLILVPRHPERFQTVADLVRSQGLPLALRSRQDPVTADTAVYVGDTLGDMMLLYSVSTFAFVGGSLVPVGGHNTLEPAVLGIPAVVGPYVHNFVEITALLKQAGALDQVIDKEALVKTILYWIHHPNSRIQAGKKGQEVVLQNRGAVDKLLTIIKNTLPERHAAEGDTLVEEVESQEKITVAPV